MTVQGSLQDKLSIADAEATRAPTSAGDTLSIAVIIATIGRAPTLRKAIDRLARQTRRPDRLIVVGVSPTDVVGLDEATLAPEIHLATRGLCSQRNHGLSVLAGKCDLVIFFDDDFLPADKYLANAERLFRENPDVVGATGRMIADGINGPGFSFEAAASILEADSPHDATTTRPRRALYGCNMVMRVSAIGNLKFDEALPLYGWQEDIDFSYRLGARGQLIKSDAIAGVHMGEKVGRTSGRRLGYSQIANPLYLINKGSIPGDLAWRIMRNNLVSNLWGSVRPEPYIDRRGRLIGNLVALRDLLAGKMHPRRILYIK
jgi:GT2 family glycosyltransferase